MSAHRPAMDPDAPGYGDDDSTWNEPRDDARTRVKAAGSCFEHRWRTKVTWASCRTTRPATTCRCGRYRVEWI